MRIVSLILGAVACMPARCAGPVTLVLPEVPAPPVRFAASELARYLAAMGNPRPEIRHAPEFRRAKGQSAIYLGEWPASLAADTRRELEAGLRGRDPDSFVIRSAPDVLLLYGATPRATLYAVYDYLESLGARWYFPGRSGEIVPRAPVKLDGYSRIETPSFRKRGLVVYANTSGFAALVDFAAKNRLNTIGLHLHPSAEALADAGQAEAARVVEPRGMALDIERHFFGDKFCPGDRAGLEREERHLYAYLDRLPAAMREFFLWAADKRLEGCTWPGGRRYSASDSVLWFSNRMAEALRRKRPDARFAFLAYLNTEAPPEHEKPGPGVFLEWAPMNQSFRHAIDHPDSPVNRECRKHFEAQLKVFPAATAQVLGYWLDDTLFVRSGYGRLPYVPEALQGDLAYYHGRGVGAVTTFGPIYGRAYYDAHASPALFLYPRLLWNVRADAKAVVRLFCREYFGSEQAAAVYDLLREADTMVYVEASRTQAHLAGDARFTTCVMRALDLARQLLAAQTTAEGRARAARLVQEVSRRLSGLG